MSFSTTCHQNPVPASLPFDQLQPGSRGGHFACDREGKWTPKLGPVAKLNFPRSARREMEQIKETQTQAGQWRLQGPDRAGGEDRNKDPPKIEDGARYRVRTCDPYRVKVVLYH